MERATVLVGVLVPRGENWPHDVVRRGVLASADVIDDDADTWEGIITWNRYGSRARNADIVRCRGGPHVVMEHGHFTAGSILAARDGHNGRGWTPFRMMGPRRWESFALDVEPWTYSGEYVLVCGQMGKGYSDMAMPDQWPQKVCDRLLELTDRPIAYLPHRLRRVVPRPNPRLSILDASVDVECALKRAYACVVWTSKMATWALMAGVPCFYCGPTVALADLCKKGVDDIEFPSRPDEREQALWDFAWQNWRPHEVAAGIPWAVLRDA